MMESHKVQFRPELVSEFLLAEDHVMLVPGGLEHFYTFVLGSWLGLIAQHTDERLHAEALEYVRQAARRYGPTDVLPDELQDQAVPGDGAGSQQR